MLRGGRAAGRCLTSPVRTSSIRVHNVNAQQLSATHGVVLNLANVQADISGLVVRDSHSVAGGGLLNVQGFNNLTLSNLTFSNASAGPWLRSQAEDLHCTAVGVSVDLQPYSQPNSTTVALVDRVAQGRFENVSFKCPLGTVTRSVAAQPSEVIHTVTGCQGETNEECCITSPAPFGVVEWSTECVECQPGSYSVSAEDRVYATCDTTSPSSSNATSCGALREPPSPCHPCPFGATCFGGSSVAPRDRFWGTVSRTNASLLIDPFILLPHGYGCQGAECTTYDACGGSREGTACGSCRPGFSEALGSSGCIADSLCWTRWQDFAFWPLYVLLVVSYSVLMYCLAASTSRSSQPAPSWETRSDVDPSAGVIVSILTTQFQLVSLAFVPTEAQSRGVLRIVGELANLYFHLGHSSDSGGVCIMAGLDAAALQLVHILLGAINLLLVLVVWSIHAGARKASKCIPPPRTDAYMLAAIRMAMLMYSAVGSAAVILFAPLHVPSHGWRLAIDGNVGFMSTWWQCAALAWFLLLTLLAPFGYRRGYLLVQRAAIAPWQFATYVASFPIAELLYRTRWSRHPPSSRTAAEHTATELGKSFRDGLEWWEAVLLGRRLLFVLVSLFFAWNVQLKLCLMTVLSTLYIVHHMHRRPFRSKRPHAVETAALGGLLIACCVNLHYATLLVGAVDFEEQSDTTAFAAVELVSIFAAPLLAIGWLLLAPVVNRLRLVSRARSWSDSRGPGYLGVPLVSGSKRRSGDME